MQGDIALDGDRCYRAAQSRDARFDGWFFTAVRTTGIYCRPSCPALTPKRSNCEFYRTAAAAQQRGFRACKRCRPDATPGSPEWDLRGDLVGRAMRMIADGTVDRDGVDGLARRLGYSARHLTRILTDELGAGPLALARAQRAQTARILIETSDLSMTEIAFAAGFGSTRQFNDTVREVYAASPSDLRVNKAPGSEEAAGTVSVRLPARPPFAAEALVAFLAGRCVPGVEHAVDGVYRRALDLPHGHAVVTLTAPPSGAPGATVFVAATFRLADWRDLAPAVARVRRLLDLDADPVAVDAALASHRELRPLVARLPGLRVAGSPDANETLVRAIVGQQVSVSGACTVLGRITSAVATRLRLPDPVLTHVFPSMAELAAAEGFPMPASRSATIRTAAERVAGGTLQLDPAGDRARARADLLTIKGIGAWTADYVVMRGLGDPDVLLGTDLGVRHALTANRIDLDATGAWSPWRSYAMHHLWHSLPSTRK